MKKLVRHTLTVIYLITLSFQSFSQTENILLDRKFWKESPTLEEVKQKIAEGHSPTEMTSYNFDATGYAILENMPLETIEFLLSQGNDVNKLTHDARTYIFWAAYKGNLELMKYLVDRGARTDITDQHGYSLFMFAAVTGQENQQIYDYVIELGADAVNERDRQGRHALLAYAGSMESGKLIDYFIDKGLDIHSVDEDGNGIFHHAAKTGSKALMELLINKYNVDTKKNPETNENAILFASRRYSHSEEETRLAFYQYLEGLGLDPAITSKKGNTVVQNLARRSKNKALIQYFIDKGVDVNQVDEEGNNALIYASTRKNRAIVGLLLYHTSNINHQNEDGISCLTRALKYNDLEVAKYLVSQGADTRVVDKNGYDLGYHVVDAYRGDMEKFEEKMNYLLSLGYHPLSIQKDGSTLLHAAINKKSLELVESLVKMGIDINAKDHSGQTILHYAAMQANDEEILKYLIAAGADKNMTTEFDESVYDLALANEMLSENKVDIDFLKSGVE